MKINTYYDSEVVVSFKQTVVSQLIISFKLNNLTNIISSRQVASFLDPRYEDLEHEEIEVRENIRCKVQNLLVETNTSENRVDMKFLSKKRKEHLNFDTAMKFMKSMMFRRNFNVILQNHNRGTILIHLNGGSHTKKNILW